MEEYRLFNAEWSRVDKVARAWIVGGKRDGAGRAHAKATDALTMPRDGKVRGVWEDSAGACVALNELTFSSCGVWMRSRVRLIVRGLRGRVRRVKRTRP